MRPVPTLIALALLTSSAGAGSTATTLSWSDAEARSDYEVDGVTVTLALLGSASIATGSIEGPLIGSSSGADDAALTFSKPIEELCVYIHNNDSGESLTLFTNGSDSDAFRAVDEGTAVSSVSTGGAFTWSGTAGADDTAACVSNAAGFTELRFDHNGAGGGLVLGETVLIDVEVDRVDTYWYSGADEDGGCGTTGSWSSNMLAAGAVTVVDSAAWPSDFDGLQRIFIACPTSDLSTAQTQDLTDFIADDGVVVVVAESDAELGFVDSANSLLGDLGVGVRVVSDDVSGSTTTGYSALVDGVAGAVSAPSSSTLRLGSKTEALVLTSSGEVVAAVEGSVIVTGDADLWTRAPDPNTGIERFESNFMEFEPCDARSFHADEDEDGFGAKSAAGAACELPEDFLFDASDCNDLDREQRPDNAEVPYDGIDQDCSGADLCDVDLDGFDDLRCGGLDCADDAAAIHPGAIEVWYDGVDQDCDGWSDYDQDLDGADSLEAGGGDCADADPTVGPAVAEVWYDGIDQDCDGLSDFDRDQDGYDLADDCNDRDNTIFPGAFELADGVDNDCNGIAEDDDRDGDGVVDEVELVLGLDPAHPDSDGDGFSDGVELGSLLDVLDSDDDGIIDALDRDDDGDGIDTLAEQRRALKGPDSDRDGVLDYLDLDSDNDGFDDAVEGHGDADFDGVPNSVDFDSDQDGVDDEDELDADSDLDGLPNRLDADDDGDGLSTFNEGLLAPDPDGDGVPNYLDSDSDGDGLSDADEGWGDTDCDGVPNAIDAEAGDDCLTPAVALGSSSCSTSSSPVGTAGLLLGLLLLIPTRRARR